MVEYEIVLGSGLLVEKRSSNLKRLLAVVMAIFHYFLTFLGPNN